MFVLNYLKENLDREKTKNFFIFLFTASIFFSLFYFFTYYIKQNSPNKDDAKLTEVKDISVIIKDYPTSMKTDEYETSRSLDACVHKYFVSKSNLNEVGEFYEKELVADGWIRQNEDTFKFLKDDFFFTLERRKERNADWNFAISICWKNTN